MVFLRWKTYLFEEGKGGTLGEKVLWGGEGGFFGWKKWFSGDKSFLGDKGIFWKSFFFCRKVDFWGVIVLRREMYLPVGQEGFFGEKKDIFLTRKRHVLVEGAF